MRLIPFSSEHSEELTIAHSGNLRCGATWWDYSNEMETRLAKEDLSPEGENRLDRA